MKQLVPGELHPAGSKLIVRSVPLLLAVISKSDQRTVDVVPLALKERFKPVCETQVLQPHNADLAFEHRVVFQSEQKLSIPRIFVQIFDFFFQLIKEPVHMLAWEYTLFVVGASAIKQADIVNAIHIAGKKIGVPHIVVNIDRKRPDGAFLPGKLFVGIMVTRKSGPRGILCPE